jgi:hypothetical protein
MLWSTNEPTSEDVLRTSSLIRIIEAFTGNFEIKTSDNEEFFSNRSFFAHRGLSFQTN